MHYGRDKYESYQDTNPYKHVLIQTVITVMEQAQHNDPLVRVAASALRLLKIEIPFRPQNYVEIRTQLDELLLRLPAPGTLPYIPEGEEVFLLRGADPLGPDIAQTWVDTATRLGVSAERIQSAQEQVNRMRDYHHETRPADLDDWGT